MRVDAVSVPLRTGCSTWFILPIKGVRCIHYYAHEHILLIQYLPVFLVQVLKIYMLVQHSRKVNVTAKYICNPYRKKYIYLYPYRKKYIFVPIQKKYICSHTEEYIFEPTEKICFYLQKNYICIYHTEKNL